MRSAKRFGLRFFLFRNFKCVVSRISKIGILLSHVSRGHYIYGAERDNLAGSSVRARLERRVPGARLRRRPGTLIR